MSSSDEFAVLPMLMDVYTRHRCAIDALKARVIAADTLRVALEEAWASEVGERMVASPKRYQSPRRSQRETALGKRTRVECCASPEATTSVRRRVAQLVTAESPVVAMTYIESGADMPVSCTPAAVREELDAFFPPQRPLTSVPVVGQDDDAKPLAKEKARYPKDVRWPKPTTVVSTPPDFWDIKFE
jgi:hypothetical protein